MLVLTRKINQSILIGDNIRVTFLENRGNQIRLGIDAPPWIVVGRDEVRRDKTEDDPGRETSDVPVLSWRWASAGDSSWQAAESPTGGFYYVEAKGNFWIADADADLAPFPPTPHPTIEAAKAACEEHAGRRAAQGAEGAD